MRADRFHPPFAQKAKIGAHTGAHRFGSGQVEERCVIEIHGKQRVRYAH